MKVKFVLTVVLSITTVLFTSCDKCVDYGEAENQLSSVSVLDEQTAMIKFAEIVSRNGATPLRQRNASNIISFGFILDFFFSDSFPS